MRRFCLIGWILILSGNVFALHGQSWIGNFSGTVSSVTGNAPAPVGTAMTGFWKFDNNVRFGYYNYAQTSPDPIFAMTLPGAGTFTLPVYGIAVIDNARRTAGVYDEYNVFSYSVDLVVPNNFDGGFYLATFNTNLFMDYSLPLTLPPLSTFDYQFWNLSHGTFGENDYWALSGPLDSVMISQVPEPASQFLLLGGFIAFVFLGKIACARKRSN